ncbi:hypothetical protein PAXINDRAFT_15198 [Paxillus involutus ATCC 200175]|uniref:XPG-I domain-containing protein n=1 Tax=Paxillus involutus ATCC 200175 TaxID=664439 RepID=A0A0C9TXJ1_PAXIN|nr:hypothetical protein PAXINDRAFT_15198 [Paxillus involutus ATCC 200175]
MGIKGLWKAVLSAADNHSLLELSINEGFKPPAGSEGPVKMFKIGIDASTWMHAVCPVSQFNHAGTGQNPEELLDAFGFGWYEAPGEAEAELAALNQHDIVDMVLTTDSDVLVFRAKCIVRCPPQP